MEQGPNMAGPASAVQFLPAEQIAHITRRDDRRSVATAAGADEEA